MIEIDWSKAPEGATHFSPETEDYLPSFIKFENGIWFCWGQIDGGWYEDSDEDDTSRYIPRPVFWSGEGLPPVGTVCEWRDDDSARWMTVEVRYLSEHTALLRFQDGVGDTEGAYAPKYCQFRPLRTLEQIKDEEKKAAIMALLEEVPGLAVVNARKIIDAGYRKVEGGAA